jgi:predicted SAM-dependent methyltransferase
MLTWTGKLKYNNGVSLPKPLSKALGWIFGATAGRPSSAVALLLKELIIGVMHLHGLLQISFLPKENIKLSLGCGRKLNPGYINIDCVPYQKGVITLDIRRPLPLPRGCAKEIITEEFLEHLAYPQPLFSVLKECKRVLKPDGRIYISVPDARLMIEAYTKSDEHTFAILKEKHHPKWCHTPMEHVNYFFHLNGQHLFNFDYETLKSALEKCGFRDVKKRGFDASRDCKDNTMLRIVATA